MGIIMDRKYAVTTIMAGLLLASANVSADINRDIVLSIEEPGEGSITTGISNLRGWAVAPVNIDRIEWFLDGEAKGVIPYGGDREDVGQQYPQFSGSELSGYSSVLNYSLLSSGVHTLKIRAVDIQGDHQESTVTFNVTAFKSALIRDNEGVSLTHADVSKQGETILLKDVDAEGSAYNIALKWNQATQSFYPTNIALITEEPIDLPIQPPKAVNDTAKVTQDSSNNSIDVLTNDTDSESDILIITHLTPPDHGRAVISNSNINYTPDSGFSGLDQFSYTINNDSTATVAVTVTATQAVAPAIPDAKGKWSIQTTLEEGGSCLLPNITADYNLTHQEGTSFSGQMTSMSETVDVSGQMNTDGSFTISSDLPIALAPGCIVSTQTEGNFLSGTVQVRMTGLSAACPAFLNECNDATYSGSMSRAK